MEMEQGEELETEQDEASEEGEDSSLIENPCK